MRVLVTGATGFVGRSVVPFLLGSHVPVVALRRQPMGINPGVEPFVVGNIDGSTAWGFALQNVDVVIHLAARVHLLRDTAHNPLIEFRSVNTDGTLNLARQAVACGVRRFVFLSTIGVNGNSTTHGKLFTANDDSLPHDPYSVSKYEAEVVLREIAHQSGMEVVIIRPPLVYGSGAPGNFGKLARLVARSLPLPLASINNRRSFVGIDNLVDFITTCLNHPAAANQTFLVSDGEDLSTPDFIRRMALAMNRPSRLFPMPKSVIMTVATMLGKRALANRLCNSLQVDVSKAHTLLGWTPPFTIDEGLRRAVK